MKALWLALPVVNVLLFGFLLQDAHTALSVTVCAVAMIVGGVGPFLTKGLPFAVVAIVPCIVGIGLTAYAILYGV